MAYSSNQFNSAILIKLTINSISMGGYMVGIDGSHVLRLAVSLCLSPYRSLL